MAAEPYGRGLQTVLAWSQDRVGRVASEPRVRWDCRRRWLLKRGFKTERLLGRDCRHRGFKTVSFVVSEPAARGFAIAWPVASGPCGPWLQDRVSKPQRARQLRRPPHCAWLQDRVYRQPSCLARARRAQGPDRRCATGSAACTTSRRSRCWRARASPCAGSRAGKHFPIR